MPASLDKLPEELCKLIIDHVDAADKSWSERVPEKHPENAQGHFDAAADKDRWSPWYGRGVCALAHVDKRWNALARPILFKSIHWHEFTSSFFQLHVLGEPLGRCVKEVDLCLVDSDVVPGVAWACALHKVPELVAIRTTVAIDAIDADLDTSYEDEALARSSGVKAMGRISALDLLNMWPEDAVSNLKLVDPLRLHTLIMWFREPDIVALHEVPAMLQHLIGLRDLELDMVYVVDTDGGLYEDPARAVLPSLKTLKLRDIALEDSLRFAAAFTPGITTLIVQDPSFSSNPEVPPFRPTLDALPQLRRVVVSGPWAFETSLLSILPLYVEHLHVKLVPRAAGFVQVTHAVGARPPDSLRELVIEFPQSAVMFELPMAEVKSLCARFDIAFRLYRRYAVPRPYPRRPGPVLWNAPTDVDETREVLAWATARVEWLYEMGDAQGLEEMVAVTERLKERRAIERS